MGEVRLTERQRDLFGLVTRAIFANPFKEERYDVDCQIAGVNRLSDRSELMERVRTVVAENVAALKRDGRQNIHCFEGEDQNLVTHLFLFHTFHRFTSDFDTHILEQIKNGDKVCQLVFGDDIVNSLHSFGFSAVEVDRYIAVFFQMRRGFYFVRSQLLGPSPCMRELRCRLWNNIFTNDIGLYVDSLWDRLEDFSTLLLGETGTGKGLCASAIGRSGFIPYSRRRKSFKESFTAAFLDLNLSQFSEHLIESELFGHAKGAFTGANSDHAGIFSRSSEHGAVFLDEIGEVSTRIQIKLLRILQERLFCPVGSHEKKRFEGRVIGATNRSLTKLREQGVFRDDFYYRLCSDTINIPPLRQRIQEDQNEISVLSESLLSKIIGYYSKILHVKVADYLLCQVPADYGWPGNVRELEQCVRRILLNGECELQSIPAVDEGEGGLAARMCNGAISVNELVSSYCKQLYERYGSFLEVGRRTGLDRRTVKKYVEVDSSRE